jgi:predicted nucleic acid-binding protein
MSVLVDTSVWIDYFHDGRQSTSVDKLIDDNLIVINEIILSELIPVLTVQGKTKLAHLLQLLPVSPISIDWEEIRAVQIRCLKKGFNGIGIPDLIIAQNASQHQNLLYSLDKHARWTAEIMHLKLF